MHYLKHPFSIISAFTLLTVLVSGCVDTTIDPFDDVGSGDYSIYGTLSLDNPRHYFRVKDVETPFLADPSTFDDLIVTFENQSNGDIVTLRDTIVAPAGPGGNYTQNFILDQNLTPRTTYTLTVNGPEDAFSQVTATTPGITQPSVPIPNIGDCETDILFIFENVAENESLVLEAGFFYNGKLIYDRIGSVASPRRTAEDPTRLTLTMKVRNLLAEVFPPVPEATVGVPPRFWRPTVNCNELDEQLFRIRYSQFGPEWSEIGSTGERAIQLLESGVVDNGIGFVGGIHVGELEREFGGL